jgi:hypothetical protein
MVKKVKVILNNYWCLLSSSIYTFIYICFRTYYVLMDASLKRLEFVIDLVLEKFFMFCGAGECVEEELRKFVIREASCMSRLSPKTLESIYNPVYWVLCPTVDPNDIGAFKHKFYEGEPMHLVSKGRPKEGYCERIIQEYGETLLARLELDGPSRVDS